MRIHMPLILILTLSACEPTNQPVEIASKFVADHFFSHPARTRRLLLTLSLADATHDPATTQNND